jgi:hypothetical protein
MDDKVVFIVRGTLDLDGLRASSWNQFNLEVDRYNAKCAT